MKRTTNQPSAEYKFPSYESKTNAHISQTKIYLYQATNLSHSIKKKKNSSRENQHEFMLLILQTQDKTPVTH